ncbi:MAG: DUF1893 domain-containing protein [Clostridia bacterium]|nr:DUF1893 domain-containing protein [Clostridia bacterium]
MKVNIHNQTEKAKKLLSDECYTCAFLKDEKQFFSKERGVKPLLQIIDEKKDFSDFFVADKVVGKAAALLYVTIKIKEIFAFVISEPAIEILQKNGISVFYENLVPRIENRQKDGFCPMEESVLNCNSPKEAYFLIKEKLKSLLK